LRDLDFLALTQLEPNQCQRLAQRRAMHLNETYPPADGNEKLETRADPEDGT
jgi:hypothetical protein